MTQAVFPLEYQLRMDWKVWWKRRLWRVIEAAECWARGVK